jgi:catechol 2,3-dioxygenase-like lactoylglutathione lyase family enzyme
LSHRSPDGAVQVLVLSRPGLALELQQHRTAQPLPPPGGKAFLRHGLFKVGIQVLDAREAVARLEAAGATVLVRPFEDQGGRLLSAVVQDPFGHTLQIIQPLQAKAPRP